MGTAGDSYNHETETSRRAHTERFGKPVSGSIPTIVRSYKSSVAYRIKLTRGTHGDPVWQRNYYEHIIRDEREWNRIKQYIVDNPFTWQDDNENPGKELLPWSIQLANYIVWKEYPTWVGLGSSQPPSPAFPQNGRYWRRGL